MNEMSSREEGQKAATTDRIQVVRSRRMIRREMRDIVETG